MAFPMGFHELSLWLAVTAIILLATAELLSPYYGQTGLAAERKKLRRVALIVALCFMATVAVRVYEILA